MVRIRHSASARPAARLISTPATTYPDPEGSTMTTSISGVKFSDQLAALLDHAIAHGFRAEPDLRGKGRNPSGVVLYAPDKDVSPITVAERGAKLNKAHFENMRRQIYAAGCPPMAADPGRTIPVNTGDVVEHVHIHSLPELDSRLKDANDEDRAQLLAGLVDGLFGRAGYGEPMSMMAGAVSGALALVIPDVLTRLADSAATSSTAFFQKEVEEALAMAAEAERRATAAEAALAKADERTATARADCGAALERARVAEAKAAELEAAVAPLRALLGKV